MPVAPNLIDGAVRIRGDLYVDGEIRSIPGGPGNAVQFDSSTARVFNVLDRGARGDGTTDDVAAINAALGAASLVNGTVLFPPGTYHCATSPSFFRYSNVTIRGSGRHASIIKPATSLANLLVTSASQLAQNITIEDLGFDGTNVTVALMNLDGSHVQNVTIQGCRFLCSVGTNSVYGANIARASGWKILDNDFHGYGTAKGIGLNFREGCSENVIAFNRFGGVLHDGILFASASAPTSIYDEASYRNRILFNTFEGDYYAVKALFSGLITGITNTVLTDSLAAFTGLSSSNATMSNIRILPVRSTGVISAVDNSEINDASATFLNDGILEGEIIRNAAETKWAYVIGVHSDTQVRHEGWRDATTFLSTSPPAVGETYTIWGVIVGKTSGGTPTATTVTTPRWRTLDGTTVTGASISIGTRYEIGYARPSYHLHAEHTVHEMFVHGNSFSRGWSDMCSLYGNRHTVQGNVFRDSQDANMTFNHWGIGRHIVQGNRLGRTGAIGIWCSGPYSEISGNVCEGIIGTENNINLDYLGAIMLRGETFNSVVGGTGCRVHHNQIDGKTAAPSLYGITASNGVTLADIEDNTIQGTITSGIEFNGAATLGNRLKGNRVTGATNPERYSNSAAAGVVEIDHAGSPEGVRFGAIGSSSKDTTNGKLYIKTSAGALNTGWKLVTQAA
jgi:hypothetical protein